MSHFTAAKELCSLPDGHPCSCYSCDDLGRQEAEQSGHDDFKQRHFFGYSLDHIEYEDEYRNGWETARHEREIVR